MAEPTRKIEVTTEITIPANVTWEEIDKWVGFDLGQDGTIPTALLEKFRAAEIVDYRWNEIEGE